MVSGELAIWEVDCEWEAWSFSPIDARRRWLGEDGCQQSVPAQCNTFARNGTTFGPRPLANLSPIPPTVFVWKEHYGVSGSDDVRPVAEL